MDGVKKGSPPQSGGDDPYDDLLHQMFFSGMFPGMPGMGGGFHGTPGMSRAGHSADAITQVEVTLEELYKGKQVKMMSKRNIICSTCKG